MRRQLLCVTVIAGVLSGCMGGLARMPSQFVDGNHTWLYQSSELHGRAEYSGAWKDNQPHGQGALRVSLWEGGPTYSCHGTFGIPRPATDTLPPLSGHLYAEGELLDGNNTVIYKGHLANPLSLADGCKPTGKGTYYWGNGWSLESDQVNGWISAWRRPSFVPGNCAINAPDGRRWEGSCTVPAQQVTESHDALSSTRTYAIPGAMRHQVRSQYAGLSVDRIELEPDQLSNPFALANGEGRMTLANGDLLQTTFDAGRPNDGLTQLTDANGMQWQVYVVNGELHMRHPARPTIAANGQRCGADGWLLMAGQCQGGHWHGDVEAYSADGQERIAGRFNAGQADGAVSWSRLDSAHQVVGQLALGPLPNFSNARITVAGVPRYEGEMQGLAPAGHGFCWVEGQPERCEYLHGARVDALYKTRQENQRMRAELAAQQEQQEQQRRLEQQRLQQERERQQRAAAQSDDNTFGKMLALGIGAAVVGSSGIDANVAAQAYGGFAADVMTEGRANGMATATQNIAAQQQAAAQAASARPALPLADDSPWWEQARSSVAPSSLQGTSMGNNTVTAGAAATGGARGAAAPTGSLAAMAGYGQGRADAEAAKSDELNDAIATAAARIGMKMRTFSYQCTPDAPRNSVNVPYQSEACAKAKEYWFQVYACNDVMNMDRAIEQCRSGCGNPNCQEAE